eukprot:SAG31_NODE_46074_length_256_cov_0.649682_1_plen_29_part_10
MSKRDKLSTTLVQESCRHLTAEWWDVLQN